MCDRDQPGYESAKVRLFSGRRPDGYIMFDSEAAAQQALQVSQSGCSFLLPKLERGGGQSQGQYKYSDPSLRWREMARCRSGAEQLLCFASCYALGPMATSCLT
jgi:hypothetical protein